MYASSSWWWWWFLLLFLLLLLLLLCNCMAPHTHARARTLSLAPRSLPPLFSPLLLAVPSEQASGPETKFKGPRTEERFDFNCPNNVCTMHQLT